MFQRDELGVSPFLSPFFNPFCPPRQISCHLGFEPRLNGINDRFIKGEESESWYFRYYDVCGIDGSDSKVDVGPKVFQILIAFADYDLPARKSRLFLVLAAWFYLVGLLVGLQEYVQNSSPQVCWSR
jgi:hypothetical protein